MMRINDFSFTPDNGVNLSARIYSNGKTEKGIIFSHGLFSSKDGYKIVRIAPHLVSCGYSLMTFNFRYIDNPQYKIGDISVAGEIEDLGYAVHEFRKYGISRIHLMGSSMGAAVSILHASQSPDTFSSLILLATPIDLLSVIPGLTKEKAMELDMDGTTDISGVKTGNRFIREIASIDMIPAVKNLISPALLVHGKMDSVVNIRNFNLFKENFTGRFDSLIIDDGDHNLTRESDIDSITGKTLTWLEQFND